MFLSLLMRIHLIWPTTALPLLGDIKPETYLTLVTMHGTIMVFFVLTTAPQGGFGNYFLPIQIGAPDMAFPVLNMLSFWTTFLGFIVMLAAFFVTGGAPLHGWTGYAPLSALPATGPYGGLASSVAAPVLVLRPSRSLRRHCAGRGFVLTVALGVLAQADFRLQGDGIRHVVHRVSRIHGVGTSHVHERDEPVHRFRVLDHDHGHRRTVSDQDVQLDGNARPRAVTLFTAD